jgi:hypothetical protein
MKNINEDLIKRSLLYMNYDSKKTLNENISNINFLTEDTVLRTGKIVKSPGYSKIYQPLKLNKPFTFQDKNYIVAGNKIVIGGEHKETGLVVYLKYFCGDKDFKLALNPPESKKPISYTSDMMLAQDSEISIPTLKTTVDEKYCKNVVVGSGSKGNDNMAGEKYWGALLERLKAAGYQFKSGVTSGTNLPIYWLGPFIIYRYGSNFITYTKGDSSGNAKISSTSYKGKYAGQVITDILLSTNVVRFTGESPNLKEWIDYLNPTKEKTPEKTKDWEDGGGVRNDPGKDRKPKPDYTPGGGGKNECKGTYSMGCITPEVGEAQQCLKDDGLYPYRVDNKFGSKTRDAVKAKIGKTYFTDADLQTICKTKKGGGGDDEYDFDKDMGGGSGQQEKEDTTWTGDVY